MLQSPGKENSFDYFWFLTFRGMCVWVCVCVRTLLPDNLRSTDDYTKTFLILLWATNTPLLQFLQPVPYC